VYCNTTRCKTCEPQHSSFVMFAKRDVRKNALDNSNLCCNMSASSLRFFGPLFEIESTFLFAETSSAAHAANRHARD
jgi:hypothetical protein